MKILVAEDDSLILKTVELKLKKEGFEVIPCIDGKEAIQKLKEKNPDVVLTDIMMPFYTGLEVVKAVRSIPGKNIPVIVFSTMGQEEMVEEAFSLGANDFVRKPFSLTELFVRIKRLVAQQ